MEEKIMRKTWSVLLLVILSLVTVPHMVAASELPVLQINALSVSHQEVSVGDYVTITVELDEIREGELIFIEYVDPVYGYYEEVYLTNFDYSTTYERSLEITEERNPGRWVIDSIHAIDAAGNVTASVFNNLADYGNTRDLSKAAFSVAQSKPTLQYEAHVQKVGWQGYRNEYELSGTTGRALRLEAIKISLDARNYGGGISYSTHIQKIGWQAPVSDNAVSGTSGLSRRLEAIKINLTGPVADHFDIFYRVHAQKYGWLSWAKNGQPAGTQGLAKRLEAIEIMLVPKGQVVELDQSQSFID